MFSGSKASSISSTSSTSLSRVSIIEANSHIQMVHSRVEQLEAVIEEQSNQLVVIERNHSQQINAMNATNQLHVQQLNDHIDSLTSKIKQLEQKVDEQNAIIMENGWRLRKLLSIKKYTPHLDKLVKLLKSLDIMSNDGISLTNRQNNTYLVNGDSNNSDHVFNDKRSHIVIGNDTDVLFDASTCSSTTSGQSPANAQQNRKSSTSKLNIARSFNITSNFSDDDEDLVDKPRDIHSWSKKLH